MRSLGESYSDVILKLASIEAGGPTAPAKIARVEVARIAYEATKARCRGGPVLEAPSEA
jgi:hypothetical protein